jgi:hypothetical protein
MTAAVRRDPLLAAVRMILRVAMAFAAVIAAALVIAIPVAFAMRDALFAEVPGLSAAAPAALGAIAGLLALAAMAAVLVFYFLRHLFRIVGSVGDGDPFVPANAARLSAMAWLTLAIHGVAFIMSLIGDWLEDVVRDAHIDIEISLSGLFLALILFVLARVFREGARMRAELEGTV